MIAWLKRLFNCSRPKTVPVWHGQFYWCPKCYRKVSRYCDIHGENNTMKVRY